MADFFNNPVVQGVLGLIAGVSVLGGFGWLKLRRDEKMVAQFLKDSGVDISEDHRTTTEIAAGTRLHEDRVRVVCGRSPRIRPKDNAEDSWKLHD